MMIAEIVGHPDVSVVIAAYDAEAFIEKAVTSALQQTACSIEVIVVDDASTDATVEVVRRIEDPRVRLLRNESNRGPSYSRNRAIAAARGTWIALLDADDWFAPERIGRLLQVAAEERADMVADDLDLIRDGAEQPFTTQFQLARQVLPERIEVDPVSFVRSNREGYWCLRLGVTQPLMRRSFLLEHGLAYDEDVRFCEDFRLYLACLLHGARFVVDTHPSYYRRRHADSITAGDIAALLEREAAATSALVRLPRVRNNRPLVRSLRRRAAEMRRQIAFLRLRRALRAKDVRGVFLSVWGDPRSLSFVVRRAFDRLRGGAYEIRRRRHSTTAVAEGKAEPILMPPGGGA